MIDSHTEPEGNTALTEPPMPAAPAPPEDYRPHASQAWRSLGLVALGMLLAVGGVAGFTRYHARPVASQSMASTPAEVTPAASAVATPETHTVHVDATQLQHLALTTVALRGFRESKVATGKIAFNEEFMTPVFSPYAGRVLRVLAKPGDAVKQGAPLVEVYTPELVQAESDVVGNSRTTLAKANTAFTLAQRTEERQQQLYLEKAVALKDVQQAQADVKNAASDVRAAEAALLAAREKLRAFGKSEAAITRIEQGQTDRAALVAAPLSGTITSRKIGPGQFIRQDNTDPLFVIADLTKMWMLANVYEADAPWIHIGQPVEVQVLAYPTEVFKAMITYIGATVDPSTHRVDVRAVVDNPGRKLKPDMFATFRIITRADATYASVPASAVVRDGDKAYVWVGQPEQQFVRREIRVGLAQEGYVQMVSGVQPGEQVAAEGGLLLGSAAGS
jgi:membrane fusion protein, heavy metal efflux system